MAVSGKFKLSIEMGNDAMQTPRELAEALRELATRVESIEETETNAGAKVLDDNGNEVGTWEYEVEVEDDDDDGEG